MPRLFIDRADAGRHLARRLDSYRGRPDVLVLALPRGGVPVAAEVAAALDAPLDVLLVRKLGVPGQEELAMGAVASGGSSVVRREIVRDHGVSEKALRDVIALEIAELGRREHVYRGDVVFPDLRGRTVILVDDGLATGSTMTVAVAAARKLRSRAVVVAVPVAPPETVAEVSRVADACITCVAPASFYSVGAWYEDFRQTTDDEVCDLLRSARDRTGGSD